MILCHILTIARLSCPQYSNNFSILCLIVASSVICLLMILYNICDANKPFPISIHSYVMCGTRAGNTFLMEADPLNAKSKYNFFPTISLRSYVDSFILRYESAKSGNAFAVSLFLGFSNHLCRTMKVPLSRSSPISLRNSFKNSL